MRELMATKSFPYGTRRLKSGDLFTARTTADARALIALRKAAPAVPATEDEPAKTSVEQLRDDYIKAFGKKPYMGWDAAALAAKIAETKAG
jgi:hypothetical protein